MKKLNALFVIVKSYHIGNHVIVEFEQLVPPVELIGRSLDSNMKTTTELECPFCHEGNMREDSCGCLTCRKCHRVEGTNCNIKTCQGARFSTCP